MKKEQKTTHKYKVGDIVKVINTDGYFAFVDNGAIVEILELRFLDDKNCYYCRVSDTLKQTLQEQSLELVKQ